MQAPFAAIQLLELGLRHPPQGSDVEVDQLHRRVQSEGIGLFVQGVEAFVDFRHDLGRNLARQQRDLDGVLLARVAHVGEALHRHVALRHALRRQVLHGLLFHLGVDAVQIFRRDLVGAGDQGADVVAAQVGHQHAPSREDGGIGGDDDLLDA